jgi:cbb3-type cytochrome oxidase maturation protein
MEAVYLLVPLAAALVGVVVAALVWAVRSGQFDDLEGPAHRILMDGDDRAAPVPGSAAPPGRDDTAKPANGAACELT